MELQKNVFTLFLGIDRAASQRSRGYFFLYWKSTSWILFHIKEKSINKKTLSARPIALGIVLILFTLMLRRENGQIKRFVENENHKFNRQKSLGEFLQQSTSTKFLTFILSEGLTGKAAEIRTSGEQYTKTHYSEKFPYSRNSVT